MKCIVSKIIPTDHWYIVYVLEDRNNSNDNKNLADELNHAEEAQLPDAGCVYAGQGVGEIFSIAPAYDIIKQVEKDAAESYSRLQTVMSNWRNIISARKMKQLKLLNEQIIDCTS